MWGNIQGSKYGAILPELSSDEVVRRLDKTIPFAIFEGDCWVIKKANPNDAYMWEKKKENVRLGLWNKDYEYIFEYDETPTGEEPKKINFPYSTKSYITMHKFAWYGFFKPDLIEVVSQLPKALFDHEKIYVTTEQYGDNLRHSSYGVHLGLTTVAIQNNEE